MITWAGLTIGIWKDCTGLIIFLLSDVNCKTPHELAQKIFKLEAIIGNICFLTQCSMIFLICEDNATVTSFSELLSVGNLGFSLESYVITSFILANKVSIPLTFWYIYFICYLTFNLAKFLLIDQFNILGNQVIY